MPTSFACNRRCLRWALAALSAGTAFAAPIAALAAPIQLTSSVGANSFGASVSDDGNRVAFYSASNLTGGNADNSFEIYLYDKPSNTLTQVSNFAAGAQAGGNQVPMLSGDGTRLSYQHFESAGGTAFFQSVLYDVSTGKTTVVTPPANAGETNELSRDGKTIAISTGNVGVRLYDVTTGTLSVPIVPFAFNTAMSRDGSKLALELFGNLVYRDLKTGTELNVTPSNSGFNIRPDLSDDGSKLAFTSTYDPLGTNADHNAEVFLFDVATQTVRQVTHSTGNSFTNSDVSISADGSRIAFSSQADLVGTNADGNQEIYVYDAVDDLIRQITVTSGPGIFSLEAAISGDGLSLAYTSSADLAGRNPNHIPQIYLQDLAPRANAVPEPSSLALLAAAGLALLACRRRKATAALP